MGVYVLDETAATETCSYRDIEEWYLLLSRCGYEIQAALLLPFTSYLAQNCKIVLLEA